MSYMEFSKKIKTIKTEVFVAGAGTAGFVAAVAAARTGAKVLLIDKLPVPGGTLTNGGIGFNSYFSQSVPGGEESRRIVGGIPYEVALRLEEIGSSTGFEKHENDHYRIPYRFMADHEALKAVASSMLMEAGVEVLLQTSLADIISEEGKIKAAIITNKDGLVAVEAKQYIDATGDGDICRFMSLKQKELWMDYDKVCGGPTGLVFGMGGIDFEKACKENGGAFKPISEKRSKDGKHLGLERYSFAHVMHKDKYPKLCALPINFFTSFQSIHPGEATYINNSKFPKLNSIDPVQYSKGEMEARVLIVKMAEALREEVPGFENSYINWASIQLGVRASVITECDYMITQEDITEARRFEDEIGLYGFHDYAPKKAELFCKNPGFYGLPYRMLLPLGADNLFIVGRCVTYDLEAHMSTRNTVCCMEMGQASGTAAALCAKEEIGTRKLDYAKLRAELLASGVILQ